MTVRRALYLLALAVIVVLLLACSGLIGLAFPFQMLGLLLIGWVLHLIHLAREMVFDRDATLTAVVALALFVVGLHWLARKWRARSAATIDPHSWSWRSTASITGLILGVAIAGIAAVGVAHQSVWLAMAPQWIDSGSLHEASAKTQSQNNLKQIALAALNHHDALKNLPPGATFDADGRPLHSWATLLLPYVEQDKLFQQIDLKRPWTDKWNRDAFATKVYVYINPAADDANKGRYAPCHYAANVHVMGAKARRFSDITDGTENTLLFGEAAGQFKAWGQPLNWRDPALGINQSPHGFGNPAMPGASFAFADGSVRFLRESISPEVLKALATPAGDEKIQPCDWE